MKVDVLMENEEKMDMLVKGVKTPFVNALRRIIISEVPVFAIEDVYFYENTSVMWDEYIAHRLGLVPLKSKYGSYTSESEERLYLEKEGPCTVYSGDLSGSIAPADEEIPIIKLAEGQRIRIECVAKVGTAKEHAKWQAGLASYRPVIRINVKNPEKLEEKTGLRVEDIEKENDRKEGVSSKIYNLCDELAVEDPEAVEIQKKEDAFIFKVESFGNMPVRDLVICSAKILEEKIDSFVNFLEGGR